MDASLSPSALEEILALLAAGDQIAAIKQYRAYTGAGLAQAKAFIDNLAAQHAAAATPSQAMLDAAVTRLLTERLPQPQASPGTAQPASAEELAAMARAQALLDCACKQCELCHAGRLDYDAVLVKLTQLCPGFSRSAYERVRGYAMVAMR